MESTTSWAKGLITPLLILACAHTGLNGEVPEGEWAISTPEGEITSVLEFESDGTVTSKSDDSQGEYFYLKDGRVLLYLSDAVMIGHFAEREDGHTFEGLLYASNQPVTVLLSESTPAKLKKAKENHQATTKLIEDSRTQQLEQLIQQNLAAIASAFQLHMLIEGKQEAHSSDIIGKGKYIPQLVSYNGEKYDDLSIKADTKSLSVDDANGKTYTFQF